MLGNHLLAIELQLHRETGGVHSQVFLRQIFRLPFPTFTPTFFGVIFLPAGFVGSRPQVSEHNQILFDGGKF